MALGFGSGMPFLAARGKRYWNVANLFASQASYDASASAGKTILTQAVATALGITNAGGINGTYTAIDGTIQQKTAGNALRITFDRGATQNMLLNSATLSTQTVTVVSGQVYTISALGTGSVALSSGGAGTLTCNATLRNQLTFTASGTSVVCTVTGSVLQANFNPGYATNYLATTGAILYTAGTPRSQNLVPYSDNWASNAGSYTNNTSHTATSVTITATAASAYDSIRTPVKYPAGCVVTMKARLSGPAGSKIALVFSRYGDGSNSASTLVTLSATPTTYTLSFTPAVEDYLNISLDNRSAGYGTPTCAINDVIGIDRVQITEGTADLPYVATTGTPYSEYPQYSVLREVGRTNLALWCRDLTNAAWTASSVTVAKTATGIDGVANSASSLTASGANGTVLQAITSTSAARITSAYVRRKTGTGVVNMTQDNGTTWTVITPQPYWSQIPIPSATAANPTIGFRIVTSGNAIEVDYVQHELGAFVTSPIGTTTASVARGDDLVRPPTTYVSAAGPQTTMMEIVSKSAATGGSQALIAQGGTQGFPLYLDGTGHPGIFDASIVVNTAAAVSADVPARLSSTYSGAVMKVCLNGGTVASGVFDGSMGSGGVVAIGDDAFAANAFSGSITRLAISTQVATDAQLQAASAGTL